LWTPIDIDHRGTTSYPNVLRETSIEQQSRKLDGVILVLPCGLDAMLNAGKGAIETELQQHGQHHSA
jgi:hypothetical protein